MTCAPKLTLQAFGEHLSHMKTNLTNFIRQAGRGIATACTYVALIGALAVPQIANAKLEPITYSKSQSATLIEVVKKLQSRHYREQVFNDELSQSYLDKYLESIDPSKMIFLQKDITQFTKHSKQFDDDFKKGKLDVPFDIYHQFRKNITSRFQKVIDNLNDPKTLVDFTLNDSVELDRSESPWPTTSKEADDLWQKRIKLALLNLRLAGQTTEEAKEKLIKRYTNQLKRIEQENSEDVFESVVNAFTLLYDPHTNYWSPRTSENFNINMSLSLEGIGAVLQSEDDFTKVVRLVTAGPAYKQGQLKPADRIVGVGQGKDDIVDIVGWRLDEVVDKIRGPKESTVRLEILPADASVGGETKIISITRGKVKLEDQAAQKAILDITDGDTLYKIGVIDLPAFYMDFDAYHRRDPDFKSSTRDVDRLLRELMEENVDGIILDLRNNGGGSLNEASFLTDLFIDQGPVVQIRQPDRPVNRQYRSMSRAVYRGPLVVMVNRLSASASEIFAGAIQDYKRGLIIGSQSFGKGTVQSVTDVKEGQLKITESKFYRVSGDSTQHRGVIPDIELPVLIDKEEVGESAYTNALIWDQIRPAPHATYFDFSILVPELKKLHDNRSKSDPDLIYITDQKAMIDENKSRKTISLNEKNRIIEKEQLETRAMTLENKRRKAKGLEVYADLKAFKKSEDDEDEEEEESQASEDFNKIDTEGDTLLIETGNILADFIRLFNNKPINKPSEHKTAKK